jgi:UDP-GlcNAc3NAcA epimerase
MRSFDRAMPEELNRVLVDHLATLLLCPSEVGAENLRAEGVSAESGATVEVVGDVMVDVAMRWLPLARADRAALEPYGVKPGAYLLLTAHRAGNVDPPERLQALVELVHTVAREESLGPLVFPVHPRTRERLRAAGLESALSEGGQVRLAEPLPYAAFAALLAQSRAVLTDSGGVQKEAYLAGVPCLTLRAETEWVETVESGWNTLVGLDAQAALRALERPLPGEHPPLYGDGNAGRRCVEAIDAFLQGGGAGRPALRSGAGGA